MQSKRKKKKALTLKQTNESGNGNYGTIIIIGNNEYFLCERLDGYSTRISV